MFELVDSNWDALLESAARQTTDRLRLVCPFIKRRTVARLLAARVPAQIEVVTRFNLADFYQGVSDVEALQMLLDAGARIRGIQGLHAKLYLFGSSRVILTSANLTESALLRNKEFGFSSDAGEIAAASHKYFERLWRAAGKNVTPHQLAKWNSMVTGAQASARPVFAGPLLPDFGARTNISNPVDPPEPSAALRADKAFVKFFGTSTGRAFKTVSSLYEVESSGCHWACTYPAGKAPRAVNDGDIMYISRLVQDPNDSMIYGRAIALRHDDKRDVASKADIHLRNWKAQWPLYIRVHHAEFLAGSIGNGVSLTELMETLGSDSFVSTQRNSMKGKGNTVPSRALMQKAHVQLTPAAFQWLDAKLEAKFQAFGTLPADALAGLDWPASSS